MRTLLGLMALSSLAALPAQAQQAGRIPQRQLGAAEARFNHPFSSIRGIRQLPDGRVMVSDGIEDAVLRVDMQSGKADTLGRIGQGPGEYKTPDVLFALPGGATMLVDLGNGRLSVFGPDGRYRESMPIAQGGAQTLSIIIPRATDAQGRLYYQPSARPTENGMPDSAAVVRWDRAANRTDTVAMVKLPPIKMTTSGGANNRSVMMRPVPLPPLDVWNVAPDGRVAIARAVGLPRRVGPARRGDGEGTAQPLGPRGGAAGGPGGVRGPDGRRHQHPGGEPERPDEHQLRTWRPRG